MATYNWSLIPNVPNRYGLYIPESDNDVRPSGMAYVALWGNDTTGNGSRVYPFRTQAKASTVAGVLILGSGVYRETINVASAGYADGDVVLDNTINGGDITIRSHGFNLKTKDKIALYSSDFSTIIANSDISLNSPREINHNVISSRSFITVDSQNEMSIVSAGNNTFINSKIYVNGNFNEVTYVSCFYFSIFDGCDFTFQFYNSTSLPPIWDYCLFNNCRFRMLPTDEYEVISTKEDLIAFIKTVHPNYAGLTNSSFGDPKFNNPTIGDYSLAFDSPAKNRSYLGTYVGALSIGYGIKADSVESDGDFDFSTNINLTIEDDSITLTDPESEASIESKVKPNLIGRELAQAPIFGFYADRNGQYIDSIADLALTTVPATNPLSINTPYIVENAAIVYDGATILAGERFTTTSVTTFTTDSGGVCREILEAPQRHTIMARFSDGRTVVDLGDPLVIGYWYYVFGTITYEGNTYTDEVFKATTTNAFTGTGDVVLAMGAELYQHYEPNVKFMSNNVGDVRTGDILRGNGDPEYERGVGKEFPINARFIQIKYIIKVNNLKP